MRRWRWIPGYEGFYEVSRAGNIRSHHFKTIRMIKLNRTVHGYRFLDARKNKQRKSIFAHRAVMFAFGPPCPGSNYVVHHKNGKRADNRLENLEWITLNENLRIRGVNGFGKYGKK